MNVDQILHTLNEQHVAYLLIGGMNYLLRHAPVVTFDVDIWVEDTPENLHRCEKALDALAAEWGESDNDWGPVAAKPPGWLSCQTVFCLTSPHGSIDVFRSVSGLESWVTCRNRALRGQTAAGACFLGLSDEDMLASQMALSEGERKHERVRFLRERLGEKGK